MENNWNQLIERYLNGELSAEGKEAFELELSKNEAFQQEMELHQLTQNLIKRTAIRNMVVKRGKAHHLKKNITTASIVALAVAAIAAAVLFTRNSGWNSDSDSAGTEQETVDATLLETMEEELQFENIDPQYFKFTGENDVFLSESGVLLSITENSFELNNKPYHGEAVIQWQEAQKASEIVKAGLSTMSGNDLLETQGMFSLNAFTPEGKPLELSNTGVYVQVPVTELKEGMMLYRGVKDENGKVDWVNPEPMEKLPIAKSMAEIDLYPPKYEPKLNELKWFTDKAKRDSLYQSFEEESGNQADSTSSPSEPTQLMNSVEPKVENPALPNSSFSTIGSVAMTGLSKTTNWLKGTDFDYLTATEAPQIGIELPEDKVQWYFKLKKIKGTDEVWVVATVIIEKDWYISSMKFPGDIFGVPTTFKVKSSTNYQIIGDPVEPSPIVFNDEESGETISAHFGTVVFKQKIRFKTNDMSHIDVDYSYQTCRTESHCLAPYKDSYTISAMNYMSSRGKRHIPPSKVLAIWNTKFDKTNLATVDFEKRMKAIHNTCDERVFDIYAKNLNTPLWQLDQQVVRLGYPEFQKFADEHVGKLNLTDAHQQNLRLFYDEAIKAIRKKGKEATLAAIKKERDWDKSLSNERTQEVYRKGLREAANRQEEFELNYDNVCKQLGRTKSFYMTGNKKAKKAPKGKPAPNIVNIDRLVREATNARQSTIIKDAKTGKTAKLTYSPFSLEVENSKLYDKLFVYLFPKEINSYQRLDLTNGKLDYKLNGDMNYKAVIVGLNETGFFLKEIDEPALRLRSVTGITLTEVSEEEFDKRINAMNSGRTAKTMEIQSEINWLFKEKANYKVQKQRRENAVFRALVRPTIYPCEEEGELNPVQANIQVEKNDWPEENAQYPGGKEAMALFLTNNLDYPQSALDDGVSGTVYLKFKILESGKIDNVEIKKGIPDCQECNTEAQRVIEKMPNWIPAKKEGKNVISTFSLPVSFKAK